MTRAQAKAIFDEADQVFEAAHYQWIEPTKIPIRTWLCRPHYIGGFVSLTVAPGGVGKSSLTMTEAIAMASGKPLLGGKPAGPYRVFIVNLEDPMDELQRRAQAICLHFGVTQADLGDRLFVNSGRTQPMVLVTDEGRLAQVNNNLIAEIIATIEENKINVLIVDPLVAAHNVPENDNSKMDLVVRAFNRIAEETGCAVMLVHHLRKTGGERGTVDDGRGASSLLAAARSARVINTMTKEEAQGANIEEHQRRFYFRADLGKANLTPPAAVADWYRLVSVHLENGAGADFGEGDHVGVVTAFAYPKAEKLKFAPHDIRRILHLVASGGPWREDLRSRREPWIGEAIAKGMMLDAASPLVRRGIVRVVNDWLAVDLLARVQKRDASRTARYYIEVGPAAADVEPRRSE
jgi:hypothetical protein